MAYSEATIATLKRELERKKNLRHKTAERVVELDKELDALEKDIKENDPAPPLPIDATKATEKQEPATGHRHKNPAAKEAA